MKRGLVTGASRGIGRAIAVRLASEKYNLIVHGRDTKELNKTCAMVKEAGGKASLVVSDISSQAGVDALVKAVGAEPIDLLVNNAGVAFVKPFEEITLDEWNQSLSVNVTAPFAITQKLFRAMPEGASIVNILSVAARTGFPGWSSYCASKFALEGLMQSVREELRSRRIRVINVYPTATNTDLWKGIEGDWPQDRMVSPDEVANAVCYAVSRPTSVLIESISVGDTSGTL